MHPTCPPGGLAGADGTTPGPVPFSCAWSESGLGAAWVRVSGELDLATTPRLALALRAAVARARLTVLDLRRVDFMDSDGALLIAQASTRAAEHHRRLVVLRGPDPVHRLFALTGTADAVAVIALHAAEPPVQALLQLADHAPAVRDMDRPRVGRMRGSPPAD